METLIFLIAVVFEVAFTAFCLHTKSNQEKVKNYLRIGAFAAFVLFTLLSVIQWNFSWYPLAALLFLWALHGAWSLLHKPIVKKEYKAFPTVLRAIVTLLLVFITVTPALNFSTILRAIGALLLLSISATPALIFPPHPRPPVTGKHPVATALFSYTNQNQVETFTSTGEKRKVNVKFWYPVDSTGGETYPLVVFSHGSMGLKTQNTSTCLDLASNGYVVCSIDSPYIALFTRGSNGRLVIQSPSIRRDLSKLNYHKYDLATSHHIQRSWIAIQGADINFVLDTVLASAQDGDSAAVYHLVDVKKIGLMGHSLGGESSAQVARERIARGEKDISAVVDLDADPVGEYVDMVNGKAVFNDTPYPVPILIIMSDALIQGYAVIPNAADVIALKHVVSTASQAFEVDFPGTNHLSFTDLALSSPILTSLMNGSFNSTNGSGADPLATMTKMNATVLRFFNVFLKGEGSFTTVRSE